MKIAIFLSIGDSLSNMDKVGQLSKYINSYLIPYSKGFDEVKIFSYADEKIENLPENVKLISNYKKMHRYLYTILLPFIHKEELKDVNVIRVYHLIGTIPAILSKVFFNKPFIFNYAYDYYKFAIIDKKYLQAILAKFLSPYAIFFADKFFVANKDIFNNLKSPKSIYLPNGVDTKVFLTGDLANKNKKIVILNVGRLESQKNQLNLIKALEGIDAQLIIIGSGSLEKELIKTANKLKVDLKIINKVDNIKISSYYQKANIFALPSLIEGHPKVLLEAMSCSCAILGTKVDGIKDILDKNNGIIVDTDVTSIKNGLKKMVENPLLREKLSKNARIFVKNNYDLSRLINEEIDAIRSL